MEVPEDKATSRAEFDKKDPISKILDSLVSLVDQHLREHRIREGIWFWSTSFQTTKKPKRCSIIGSLHWQTTRLRTYLVPSSKRRLVEAKKKKKKKSKDIFKGIASSNQPFGRGALPNRDDRRRRNRGFTFSFIGLNFT